MLLLRKANNNLNCTTPKDPRASVCRTEKGSAAAVSGDGITIMELSLEELSPTSKEEV
jgi:hypothetical protein